MFRRIYSLVYSMTSFILVILIFPSSQFRLFNLTERIKCFFLANSGSVKFSDSVHLSFVVQTTKSRNTEQMM